MTDELLAGRYQLEQELGRGGMATVFLARDTRLARRVAVKVMHPGEDGRRAERFRREAELAASIKHPHVLEVHDFGEDARRGPFLVCEWVQGEDLRALAHRLAPVPPVVAAVLGWTLARALGEAHAHGVVHRDVKPENVLLSRSGTLKLADFGLAALADDERLTSTGTVTGSLAYMAPERLDTGAFSPASDVYAVGVLLFELVAGTTPHAGKGSGHLVTAVMTRDAPRLDEVVPGTPEPLAELVARCLARDARARPRNGAELASLLEGVVGRLAGPPAEVSRGFFQEPEAGCAKWREVHFQRLLEEGGALLSKGEGARAAKLLNAALSLRPDSAEVRELLRARPPVRRSRALVGGAVLACLLVALGVWVWARHPGAPEAVVTAPVLPATSPPPEPVAAPVQEPAPELVREQEATAPVDSEPVPRATRTRTPRPVPSKKRTEPPAVHPVEPLRVEAPPVAVAETPSPKSQEPATLQVVTRPWAEVFVDGQSRGYTPRVRELRLSPGTHRLRFDNPLCDPIEEILQVSPGESVSRELTLRVRKAEVRIVAPVGALILVDGTELGVAPLPGPVTVEHGGHVFSARVPGGGFLRREVNVVAGARTEVVLRSSP
ncbi:protein kinase [Archangium violaceum]|uniref:serine/threonine-protein kinase n=1 Tax=Archangium violaceum TaxID=83451 RepID=UPI00193C59B0|nr:serine/threonine-protein kinase [Archangium violaceum]QRK10730.1 protein kinase [Archangium violaceum]